MQTPFGPVGDSVVLALTQSSQTFALGSTPADGASLRLQSLNSGQTAWYVKFGTSGAVTVSTTDGMRVIPGGQDAPVVVPIPVGSTHYAILADGVGGNVLASYGGYDEATFSPIGASQVVTVTTTDQRIALPALGTISPAIRLVATSPAISALWVKLGNVTVTGSVTTSMKVFPGSVEDPTIIPVTNGETHLSIFCEGVGGTLVLSPGQVDHSLPFDLSRSGHRFGVMPYVAGDGVMEVGAYIDFHGSNADTSDFLTRVQAADGSGLFYNASVGSTAGQLQRVAALDNATLAAGDMLYWGGAAYLRIAGDTSGKHLRTQGTGGSAPIWEYPGQTLLATASVFGVAAVAVVLTSFTAFTNILIDVRELIPATDDTQFMMRTSTNGGVSYDSGATDYIYATLAMNSAEVLVTDGSTGTSQISLSSNDVNNKVSNDAGARAAFRILLPDRLSGAAKGQIEWEGGYLNTIPSAVTVKGTGFRNAAQDVDAVQFLMSSGNISAMLYSVYGWS